jgi:hypothetical protein
VMVNVGTFPSSSDFISFLSFMINVRTFLLALKVECRELFHLNSAFLAF